MADLILIYLGDFKWIVCGKTGLPITDTQTFHTLTQVEDWFRAWSSSFGSGYQTQIDYQNAKHDYRF